MRWPVSIAGRAAPPSRRRPRHVPAAAQTRGRPSRVERTCWPALDGTALGCRVCRFAQPPRPTRRGVRRARRASNGSPPARAGRPGTAQGGDAPALVAHPSIRLYTTSRAWSMRSRATDAPPRTHFLDGHPPGAARGRAVHKPRPALSGAICGRTGRKERRSTCIVACSQLNRRNVEALYQSGFLLALDGAFSESRTFIDETARGRPGQSPGARGRRADSDGSGDADGARPRSPRSPCTTVQRRDVAGPAAGLRARGGVSAPRGADRAAGWPQAGDTGRLLQRLAASTRGRTFRRGARGCSSGPRRPGPTVPLLTDLARVAYNCGTRRARWVSRARPLARAAERRRALSVRHDVRRAEPRSRGLRFVEEGRRARPGEPARQLRDGRVATHRHDASESLPYFEKYVRLKPDDPRGRFALGAARFYSGQLDAARPDLARRRAP